MSIKNNYLCQMTIAFETYQGLTGNPSYAKCGKPAKFKVPNPKMNIEYVCGIHARSLDKMYERTGQNIKCLPI
jgi:hypothetical protein